ncbi:RNA/RNP complex-1-interacting phosphatase isoform X2 [Cherax quadricarinatus]
MGRQIPGTRFIAFKVPLRETIMQKVRHAEWFCPRTLMDHCVNLGLVVDLTNTSRYYDPQVFISQGIEYAKLFTEGKIIPRNNNVYKFFNVVNNFLKQNKDNEKLIGVHCTHGLNRTGYMICRYMIQQLRIPSDQAIADYNSARGHAQERENYLADLRKAEWINEAIPVVSVDVQKGSAITTINPFTSNSPDGTSTSIRRPSLDKYLKGAAKGTGDKKEGASYRARALPAGPVPLGGNKHIDGCRQGSFRGCYDSGAFSGTCECVVSVTLIKGQCAHF